MNLSLAIALASNQFVGRMDKGGQPYILHCLRVMNNLHTRDHELMSIAILHDVVEDTDITFSELRRLGFSDRVINTLQLLTHDKSVPYMDYIYKLAISDDARIVKMADLEDNSSILRLKGVGEKDTDRMKKYHQAFTYLLNYK